MIGIVVLGTVVMDSGILLLVLERWRVARRPLWRPLSPASMGRIGPMLEHIAQVEGEMARLDRAIDTVLPEHRRGDHGQDAPARAEVTDAYTTAGARLVALSGAHLRRPPSAVLCRFVRLSRDIGDDLDDDWDPHADELAALRATLRDLHLSRSNVERLGVTPWESAVERYMTERRRRATTARNALLEHLDAVGDALRADLRRRGPTPGQTAADLEEVNRELRRTVVAQLDSLRPLLVRGRWRTALRKRDRTVLVGELAGASRQLAAADVLARSAPLASLSALAALPLPVAAGRPPDAAFATGCRAVEAGLRVCAASADADLSKQITHYAASIDAHLDSLHTAVVADAHVRRRLHHTAFRSVLAAADCVTLAVARALLGTPPVDTHIPTPRAPMPAAVALGEHV